MRARFVHHIRVVTVAALSCVTVSCGQTEEAQRAAEAAAYARSVKLTHTDSQGAREACEEIQTHWLRDECLMLLTRERVRHEAELREICDELHDPYQRHACWLEVADALEPSGDLLTELCTKAGDLRERCLVHAFQRELSTHSRRYGPGQEADFFSWIESRATELGVIGSHRQFAVKQTSLLIARRRLRGISGPFTLKECGSADSETCMQAYRVAILQGKGNNKASRQMCDGGVTAEEAARAGFLTWAADADAVASQAWVSLCRDPGVRAQ